MLDIAQNKSYSCPIIFQIEDAYNLSFAKNVFTGGLANFWFSHIPKSKLAFFLNNFHRVLRPGASVFIADNVYIPHEGGELIVRPHDENTYKLRTLQDGSQYEILKNYYTKVELLDIFKKYARSLDLHNVIVGKRFWRIVYNLI